MVKKTQNLYNIKKDKNTTKNLLAMNFYASSGLSINGFDIILQGFYLNVPRGTYVRLIFWKTEKN